MTDVETLFFIKRNLISFGNKLLTKDMLMYKLDAGTSEAGTSEAGTSEAGAEENMGDEGDISHPSNVVQLMSHLAVVSSASQAAAAASHVDDSMSEYSDDRSYIWDSDYDSDYDSEYVDGNDSY